MSILFPSTNTDFVSIIISHTRHIFQLANTAAMQVFHIAAVIFWRSLPADDFCGAASPLLPSTISFFLLIRVWQGVQLVQTGRFRRKLFLLGEWLLYLSLCAFERNPRVLRLLDTRLGFFLPRYRRTWFRRELRCPGHSCVCFRGTGERGQKTFHPFLFPERYAMMINRITRKGRVRHARRAAPPAQ